jgi:hypothetical protein
VPSRRAIVNTVITERIRQVHADSDQIHGLPRVCAELMDRGLQISRQHVARLMPLAKLRGASRRRSYVVTKRRDKRPNGRFLQHLSFKVQPSTTACSLQRPSAQARDERQV